MRVARKLAQAPFHSLCFRCLRLHRAPFGIIAQVHDSLTPLVLMSSLLEAMSERKDVKRYCSVTCQANAKSARQYRRRKIREAITSECSNDAYYLLHYLDDPTITLELVQEVLATTLAMKSLKNA